ncbi:four helix bundle protein [Rubritalea squalenifaciens DSM 18772]|uniref:Four helix bundle protein n=1 Tax=Rubritalea squalenifaciens DSM 18772 TaxID=1123071 RepID=A0A1M6E2G5_9BACT|nr:four helix bundle protein [Rubritalea squalenifaciens]SHI79641.1 four helix bundle protein [Rubritalea squalenifaciens DSM 18772]
MSSKTINDLEIYREAMSLAEEIWALVVSWDGFAKSSLGLQLVRSTDSIAANLTEGYGRFHYKENQKFCFYARGSLQETQTWVEKAARRGVIPDEMARQLYAKLETLKKRLNAYISSIGQAAST